jgi:tetratricopeptide (TPR) repeat protein
VQAKDYEKAAVLFYQVLESNPDHAPALNSLARLYVNAGKFKKARNFILKILQSNPKDSKANITLLAVQMGLGKEKEVQKQLETLQALGIKDLLQEKREIDNLEKQWKEKTSEEN